MKKKILISIMILIIIVLVIYYIKRIKKSENHIENETLANNTEIVQKQKKEENEIVNLINKIFCFQIDIKKSYDNQIDSLKEEIEDMKYIKNVEIVSKERNSEKFLESLNNKISIDKEDLSKVLPNKFIVRIEINTIEDLLEIKGFEEKLNQLEWVDKILISNGEIIKIYEEYGYEGMKEFFCIYSLIDEKKYEEAEDYLEKLKIEKELKEILEKYIILYNTLDNRKES